MRIGNIDNITVGERQDGQKIIQKNVRNQNKLFKKSVKYPNKD